VTKACRPKARPKKYRPRARPKKSRPRADKPRKRSKTRLVEPPNLWGTVRSTDTARWKGEDQALALPLLRQVLNSPSLSGRRARRARRTWQRPTLTIRSSSWRPGYLSTAAQTVVDVAWEGHHRQ